MTLSHLIKPLKECNNMPQVDLTQVQALVTDVETKLQALSDATDANNQAQTTAQAAISTAAQTAQAQTTAHDDLTTSIQTLDDYLVSLANGTAPAPAPAPDPAPTNPALRR